MEKANLYHFGEKEKAGSLSGGRLFGEILNKTDLRSGKPSYPCNRKRLLGLVNLQRNLDANFIADYGSRSPVAHAHAEIVAE